MSLEFEKKLGSELTKLGIDFQFGVGVPGTNFEIDFYIKAPVRGLIEIKHSIKYEGAKRIANRLKELYYQFNGSIYLFLITFTKLTKSQKDYFGNLPIEFITVTEQQKNPEEFCARAVRAKIVHEAIQLKKYEIKRYEKRIKEAEKEKASEIKQLTNQEHEIKHLIGERRRIRNLIQTEKDDNKKKILLEKREKKFEIQLKHLSANISYLSQHLEDLNAAIWKWKHRIASLKEQVADLLREDRKSEKEKQDHVSLYARRRQIESDPLIESDPPVTSHIKDSIMVEHFEPKEDKPDTDTLSSEQAQNLEKTKFTTESSFKVINVFRVKGNDFIKYFPHLKKWSYPMQVIQTDKGWFVDATVEWHGYTEWQKLSYHNCRVTYSKGGKFKPLWLQKDNIFNRKPIDDGLFSNMLSSFQTFMSPDTFEILEKEVDDFEEEYRSKHYTTAVLRIGRTLEYVIYTLVQSWGVTLNKPTMERIDILNDQFEKLSKHLIYYYTSEEDEKGKNRKNLIKVFKETNGALVDMQTDLDQTHDVNPSKHKVNIDALLRDVKNRYGKNEAVRNEINKLTGSELIQKLYLKRNEAAHADVSGRRREFAEEEVKKMADNLNVILFHLANIHDTIAKSSSEY
jgi:hypothetical protein